LELLLRIEAAGLQSIPRFTFRRSQCSLRSSGKASFKYFRQTSMASADSVLEVRNDPASDSKGQVANPLGGWEAKSD
jgi:hypothetical protein